MKKFVVAAGSADKDVIYKKAERILKSAKDLLDYMEDTPSGFLDNNDLGDLYEELIETIPAFQIAIRSKSLEY